MAALARHGRDDGLVVQRATWVCQTGQGRTWIDTKRSRLICRSKSHGPLTRSSQIFADSIDLEICGTKTDG